MKRKTFLFAGLIFLLITSNGFSQSLYMPMDSLRQVIKTTRSDTTKINATNWLSYQYYFRNVFDSSMKYAKEALSFSEQIAYKDGIAFAYINFACFYMDAEHDYPKALEYNFKALQLFEEIQNKYFIAIVNYNIGLCYTRWEKAAEALKYLYKSLKLFEEVGDKNVKGVALHLIGGNHYTMGNKREAIKCYMASLNVRQQTGDKFEIANSYLSIGGIFEDSSFSDALYYYWLALRNFREIEDPQWGIPTCYYAIADIYQLQGDSAISEDNKPFGLTKYLEAKKFYLIGLDESQKSKSPYKERQVAWSYNCLGKICIKLTQYAEAEIFLSEGKRRSFVNQDKNTLQYVFLNLSTLDSISGNYKQALNNYKNYILYRDSITNEESVRQSERHRMQYDFDKKEDSLKQQHFVTETKLTAQKKQRYFYWVGLGMLAVLSFFVFLNFRNQKKINRLANEAYGKQKAELELQSQQAILSERLRISSELHDEVGATLSGIAMYGHLAKEQMSAGQTAEIEKSLNVMQQSSAQMVDKLSDIVWLINPQQDSLQKLIARLEEYATDMAAIKNMQVNIVAPSSLHEKLLPVETRRNIYLFCKEAINNAVKYSGGNLLELVITETDGKLEFTVSDNGKGFDAVMVRRGNGLENMQKRADEIGAKLVLQSKENEGASVSFHYKIT